MKKAIAIAVSFMMILTPASAVFSGEYTDIKEGNWAYDAVSAMSGRAVVKGYPDGSFKPGSTVTYAEFIKMALIAATGEDVGNSPSGNWALNYYNKALELKYFTVYDVDKSQLNDKITRAHMALIISSILGDVKIDHYDEIRKGMEDITDKTEYEYDITKAYSSGILTGYTDKTFKPEKTLSRAESATVIYRLMDEGKRVLPGDEDAEMNDGYKLVNTADYVDVSTVANVKTTNTGDFTEKAELYADAGRFDIAINKTWTAEWGSSFDHRLNGFIYLVKDGKVVDYCPTTPHYDSDGNFEYSYGSMADIDVTNADYILVTRPKGSGDLVKLIPNPLR